MPLKGAKEHIARLRRLYSPEVQEAIGQAMFDTADAIKAEAQHSITAGSVSGKFHKPSLPGEPPMNDTGVLRSNITATRTGKLKAEVRSEAPYSQPLEFGSSKISARPFMRPARDKAAKTLPSLAVQKINAVVRGK
jgi:HK97 gp10 family phage protein